MFIIGFYDDCALKSTIPACEYKANLSLLF